MVYIVGDSEIRDLKIDEKTADAAAYSRCAVGAGSEGGVVERGSHGAYSETKEKEQWKGN